MKKNKKIDWIDGILSLVMFGTSVIALFCGILLLRLIYNSIVYMPHYEKGNLKVYEIEYRKSKRSRKVSSVFGHGILLKDSTKAKVRLDKTTKLVGIPMDGIKSYLVKHDSIVSIWSTKNGKMTVFRYEGEGETFNWGAHYNKTITIFIIGIMVFIIPFHIRRNRNIKKM